MTTMTTADIAAMIAAIHGTAPVRYATKDKAAARFTKVATEAGIDAAAILSDADPKAALEVALAPKVEAPAVDHSASNRLIADALAADPEIIAPARRKAALALVMDAAPEATAKVKKARAAKPKAEPKAKEPTKREVMLDMVRRPEGATEQEICEAIGWKACLVTLRRAAEAEKITLRVEKVKGGRARYFAPKDPQAIAAE